MIILIYDIPNVIHVVRGDNVERLSGLQGCYQDRKHIFEAMASGGFQVGLQYSRSNIIQYVLLGEAWLYIISTSGELHLLDFIKGVGGVSDWHVYYGGIRV